MPVTEPDYGISERGAYAYESDGLQDVVDSD